MRLPPPLRGFLAASALFALLCVGTEEICRKVLHLGPPYDHPGIRSYYPVEKTQIRFVDFHAFFGKFRYFHSRKFYTESAVLPYPAPAVVAYKPFLIPSPSPHHGFWALVRFEGSFVAACLLMGWLWKDALGRRGITTSMAMLTVAITLVCSFAVWFEFLQGNIEWVVWVILSLGVWAFCTFRFRTAAVLIGVAGSMKIFPIIYLGLFLSKKQYRYALYTSLSAAGSTVVSLWLVCPEIAYSWHQTLMALTSFEHEYVVGIRPVEIGFDHSLFALLKLISTTLFNVQDPQARLGLYLATVALVGIILFFLRIRYLPLTNQVLCLSVAAILLPPVSYDYTLLHLYPGLVLLISYALYRDRVSPQETSKALWAALLLLAFLLSPESELIWHGIRYAGQLKALSLVALAFVSLRWPFEAPGLPEPSRQTPPISQDPNTVVVASPA